MANSIITAAISSGSTALENSKVVVTYYLDPLASATTVHADLAGIGATTADYTFSSFSYHMGDVGNAWTPVPAGGMITLNAGYDRFQLAVDGLSDTFAESSESIVFTIAQTANSVGLADSWWVPSSVNLLDQAGTGVNAPTYSISANPVLAGGNGVESKGATVGYATVTYHIDGGPLAAASPIKVNVAGQGALAGTDYDAFEINNNGGVFAAVDPTGLVTLPIGTTDFSLRVHVMTDSLAEYGESVLFTAAQTANSVGLVNSWWVPSAVNLEDAPGTGVHLTTQTHIITADTIAAVVNESTAAATALLPGDHTNASHAVAGYTISGTGLAADTTVKINVSGQPATVGADYDYLQYQTTGGLGQVGWTDVDPSGLVPLTTGNTHFDLRVAVLYDTLAESNESLLFTVGQTGSSTGLADSWWVPSVVTLGDAAGTGNAVPQRDITADVVSGVGTEGGVASVGYHLSGAIGADTPIKVNVIGQPATPGADYNAFKYTTTGGPNAVVIATAVDPTGIVTLPSGTTDFDLQVTVLTDSLIEVGESLMFTVAQTASSVGLVNSWWVPSIIGLADATGPGAFATHSISAVPVMAPATETSPATPAVTSYATATFNLDGALSGDNPVNVNVFGQPATAGVDYSGFEFNSNGGAWASASSGTITLPNGTTTFNLRVAVASDTLTESNEALLFTVAQTAASAGLVNSWYVSSTVQLADAAVNIVTGKVGADNFVGTGGTDIFVVPSGTSTAHSNSGYATGLSGGDTVFTSGTDFDTITGFVVGTDKIDLPITVGAFVNNGSAGTSEESFLAALSTPFALAAGTVATYIIGSNVYLLANTSGDANWTATDDIFIKIVGLSEANISAPSNFI